MHEPEKEQTRRVLIASSHPLFGQGLRNLLNVRQGDRVKVVGMVSNLEQTLQALHDLSPDLLIVDNDDEDLNRDEVLARFVESEKKLRLVLLSLQSSQDAIVYDRRTLAASQIDNWLEEWSIVEHEEKNYPIQKFEYEAPTRRNHMKHLVIAGILVLIVTTLLILGLEQVRLLPAQASVQAQTIDQLFSLEFKVIAFLFALIVVFMLYSIFVFRRKPGDTTDAAHIEGNTKLEIAWTLAPLATVMVFAVLGGQSLAETMRAEPRALEINVIGQQWAWRFEYPQYEVTSDTLWMPIDKQAILHLSSEDVIHSFWVPEFRVKQDALPGGEEFVRNIRVTPTILGDYKVRCAELCGTRHATMLAPVKVVSLEEFDAWIASQSEVLGDPVARGEKWSREAGCIACHSVDGTPLVGPSWLGVFGKEETMTDGTLVTIDEDYLRESILNPNSLVVQGYPANVMPADYGERLTLEQIQDIIEYIKSLK